MCLQSCHNCKWIWCQLLKLETMQMHGLFNLRKHTLFWWILYYIILKKLFYAGIYFSNLVTIFFEDLEQALQLDFAQKCISHPSTLLKVKTIYMVKTMLYKRKSNMRMLHFHLKECIKLFWVSLKCIFLYDGWFS